MPPRSKVVQISAGLSNSTVLMKSCASAPITAAGTRSLYYTFGFEPISRGIYEGDRALTARGVDIARRLGRPPETDGQLHGVERSKP